MKFGRVIVAAIAFLLIVGSILFAVSVLWRGISPAVSPEASDRKPALTNSAATAEVCLPVRTTLAYLALAENPTARTYAVVGREAGALTNVLRRAGLEPSVRGETADVVLVSGERSRAALAQAWERCATNGVLAVHYNVRKRTFAAFRGDLNALPASEWRLWFPGHADALVTLRRDRAGTSRLADIMDLFIREEAFADQSRAGIGSPSQLFASYVGTAAEVLPAFAQASGEVVPECFVPARLPTFDWIDTAEVEADIRDRTLKEMKAAQVIRRMILEGDILSREGKPDRAMEKWAAAAAKNPDDPLNLERLCLLDVAAETFLKIGNLPGAANSLATMIGLRPYDPQLLRRQAAVLNQLGKKDLSEQLLRRAGELERAR